MKSFSVRLAALEAIETAERVPQYVCMHARDYAALDDSATPAAVCAQIVAAYQLSGQKLYIGLCHCDPGESCRVCGDQPVIGEM